MSRPAKARAPRAGTSGPVGVAEGRTRGPAQRHGTSQASTLPVWQAEAGEARGTLNLTCPWKDCGGKCIVNAKKWRGSRPNFIGRSCPYCFRTARLP